MCCHMASRMGVALNLPIQQCRDELLMIMLEWQSNDIPKLAGHMAALHGRQQQTWQHARAARTTSTASGYSNVGR